MRDLPTGPTLLALTRDVLLNELLPLLPPAAHLEARLVANSMAIAEREAISGAAPAQGILRELEELYGEGGEGEARARKGSCAALRATCAPARSRTVRLANATRARYCGASRSPSCARLILGS